MLCPANILKTVAITELIDTSRAIDNLVCWWKVIVKGLCTHFVDAYNAVLIIVERHLRTLLPMAIVLGRTRK